MNTRMKCIIVDDEPLAIEIIKDYVEKTSFLILLDTFREPVKALEYLQKNITDLVFLDINMPDLSGLQFLNTLTYQPLIIFTTAYSQYAVDSYDYNAVDYLLKPIEFTRFVKAVNKALEKFNLKNPGSTSQNQLEKTDCILIKSGTEIHRVAINDILYIKGAGNYVLYYTINGKIISLSSMKNAQKKLPGDHFLRIHKSFIINFNNVEIIEKESVQIKGRKIPIGESFKENVESFLK